MYAMTAKLYSSGLPSKVRIGPVTYQVIMANEPTAPGEDGEDKKVFGMVNFRRSEIIIDQTLTAAMQWQCYWHEILHVMFEQLGLEDPGEGHIDAFAYKLFEILLDNGFLQETQRVNRGGFPSLESPLPGTGT